MRPIIDKSFKTSSDQVKESLTNLAASVNGTADKQLAMAEKLLDIAQSVPTSKDLEQVIRPNPVPPLTIRVKMRPISVLDENGNEVERLTLYDGQFTITADQLDVLKRSLRHADILVHPGATEYRRAHE